MKVNKTISIDTHINERLARVANASALIERLLQEHFAFLTLEDAKPEDLSGEKEELKKKMDVLEQREVIEKSKGTVLKRLADIGIKNKYLINHLKNSTRPEIFQVRALKESYPDEHLEMLQLTEAWEILHE